MTIGEKIRIKRIELGISQEELAFKCGYKSRSSINKLELSRNLPLCKVKLIAKALNVNPSWLLGFEEENITQIKKCNVTVGSRIKSLRTKNNMLQSELAMRLGVTRSAVSAWEVCRTEPSLEIIEKMSAIFNCPKTDIIGSDIADYLITSGPDEYSLIEGYRNADETTKEMVRRIIKYSKAEK